jgi:type II secretory pathway component PulF
VNDDEFAFFNQQLAGMLRSGIPIEGALAQLCRNMRKKKLRRELELLGAKLREGIPLGRALESSGLPPAYVQMVKAGAQSQNLPSILTLVADYYGRLHGITTRLKGLMVYPAIILICSFGLSLLLSMVYWQACREMTGPMSLMSPRPVSTSTVAFFWMPSLAFLALLIAFLCLILNPKSRNWMRWRLPGLKDASLAQSASTLSALLSTGTSLDTSLALAEQVESRSPAGLDLRRWRKNVEEGRAKFPEMAQQSRTYPPLFIWLVAQGGEDLGRGFDRAAEIYGARAQSRTDMLLYAALPLAVVVVGVVILGQTVTLASVLGSALGNL